MLPIAGVYILILATHLPGLLKAGQKTALVFGLIWTAGLSISLIAFEGLFLPVTDFYNRIFEMVLRAIGASLPTP